MFQELRLAKRGIQPKSSQCRNLGFERICIKSNRGAVDACESNSPILLGFLRSALYRSEDFGLKSRASLEAENIILRQQVIVLSRKAPSRVRLRNIDRLIFIWPYRCFPAILNVIIVVKPETVIQWHPRGCCAHW